MLFMMTMRGMLKALGKVGVNVAQTELITESASCLCIVECLGCSSIFKFQQYNSIVTADEKFKINIS